MNDPIPGPISGAYQDEPEKVPEWLTSYLDGEALDEEKAKAKKELSSSSELKREAEDLQKAWDLLDFLPRTEAPPAKSRATIEMVLAQSGTSIREEGIAEQGSDLEQRTDLDRRTEHRALGVSHSQVSTEAKIIHFAKAVFPLAGMALSGLFFGVLILVGWKSFEEKRYQSLLKNQGVVENLQLLRETGSLEFLQSISQAELFGQNDSKGGP